MIITNSIVSQPHGLPEQLFSRRPKIARSMLTEAYHRVSVFKFSVQFNAVQHSSVNNKVKTETKHELL